MKIETSRYKITSDSMNIILQFKQERQDSHFLEDKTKIGEVILGRKLYFKTLEGAYQEIARFVMVTEDEVNSLEDIKQLLVNLTEEVKTLSK